MHAPQLPLTGSCLCGSVFVHVSAAPLLTFACHCRDCQKFSASAFSLTAMIPIEGLAVNGDTKIGGLRAEQREHHFCSKCMNFIYSRIKGVENRVNLRVSLLDDLTWFEPFVELMTAEKLAWSHVPASHSFATFPETTEELESLMADYAGR